MKQISLFIRRILSVLNVILFWSLFTIIIFFLTKYYSLQVFSNYENQFPELSFYFLCLLLLLSLINILFQDILAKKWIGVVGKVAYLSVGVYLLTLLIKYFRENIEYRGSVYLDLWFNDPKTLLEYTNRFLDWMHLEYLTKDIFSLNMAIMPLTIILVLYVFRIYRYYRFQKKNTDLKKMQGLQFLDQSVLLILISFLLGYLLLFNRDYLSVSVCVVIVLGFSTYHMISIYVPKLPRVIHSQALIRVISIIQVGSFMLVTYLSLIIPLYEIGLMSVEYWFSLLIYSQFHIFIINILAIAIVITIVMAYVIRWVGNQKNSWKVS